MIKYTKPMKIEKYSNRVEQVVLNPNKKIDLTVLSQSKTLDMSNLVKTASKVVKIAPKEDDFLYVRVRAVSAGNVIEQPDGSAQHIDIDEYLKNLKMYGNRSRGCNSNGDFFSYEELKRTYKTFIGKSAFVDHNNENVENARGIILDAIWNERGKFVELLIAVDKKGFPELCRGIEMGYITDVSMGCRCSKSVCSYCGNEAITEDEFCEHVKMYKGGTYNGIPVFEDNRGVEFFEISFVSEGADRDAKILEKVASRNSNKVNTQSKTAYKNDMLVKVASEKNKRYEVGEKSFFDRLKDLPWS
jgi:hypothetical protein